MPKLTPAQDSLVVRIALAVVALEQAQATMAALGEEAALRPGQKRNAERMTGTLDGMAEAIGYWRPRNTGGSS